LEGVHHIGVALENRLHFRFVNWEAKKRKEQPIKKGTLGPKKKKGLKKKRNLSQKSKGFGKGILGKGSWGGGSRRGPGTGKRWFKIR